MRTSKHARWGLCRTLMALLFLVFVPGQIWAQQPCDSAECMGDEIWDAASLMTNAACDTAAVAKSDSTGIFAASTKAKLDDACTRSKNWVNADYRKSDFVKFGKRKKAECYLAERLDDGIGDDDGFCTDDEKGKKLGDEFGCEEAVGNGNGICEIVTDNGKGKKKVWEQCLEVCDEVDPQYEQNEDVTAMKHMAGAMRDAAGALDDANAMMLQRLEVLKNVQAVSAQLNGDDPDPVTVCDTAPTAVIGGVSYGYEPGQAPERSNTLGELRGAILAADILGNSHDICVDAADNTIFGTDFPAACIPVAVGAIAAITIAQEWELLDDTITSTRIDNMTICMQYLGEAVDGINEKLDEIIGLLNMPQGQRPDFPTKP